MKKSGILIVLVLVLGFSLSVSAVNTEPIQLTIDLEDQFDQEARIAGYSLDPGTTAIKLSAPGQLGGYFEIDFSDSSFHINGTEEEITTSHIYLTPINDTVLGVFYSTFRGSVGGYRLNHAGYMDIQSSPDKLVQFAKFRTSLNPELGVLADLEANMGPRRLQHDSGITIAVDSQPENISNIKFLTFWNFTRPGSNSVGSLGEIERTAESHEVMYGHSKIGINRQNFETDEGTIVLRPILNGNRDNVVLNFPVVNDVNRCPDITQDRYVNSDDLKTVAGSFGSKEGDVNFNPLADVNNDGIINIADQVLIAKEVGKIDIEIPECGGKPRNKLCPDFNGNGIVDRDDVALYADDLYGVVAGDENYIKLLDYNDDGKIDITDTVTVSSLVGKDSSEFGACEDIGELEEEFERTKPANPSPGEYGLKKGESTTFKGETITFLGHEKIHGLRIVSKFQLGYTPGITVSIAEGDKVNYRSMELKYVRSQGEIGNNEAVVIKLKGVSCNVDEMPVDVIVYEEVEVPTTRTKGLTTTEKKPGFFGRLAKSLGLVIFDA